MKERPILFSAPMVRAILDGRKTQTRRALKPQPEHRENASLPGNFGTFTFNGWNLEAASARKLFAEYHCPYGKLGDRLWVRETFNVGWLDGGKVLYRADGGSAKEAGYPKEPRWTPGIHMFRRYSRITLEITEVRVQRLQDISTEDAEAEGFACCTKDGTLFKYGVPDRDGMPGGCDVGWPWHEWRMSPVDAYERLWNDINGSASWSANPWVWAVSFKRVEAEQAKAA